MVVKNSFSGNQKLSNCTKPFKKRAFGTKTVVSVSHFVPNRSKNEYLVQKFSFRSHILYQTSRKTSTWYKNSRFGLTFCTKLVEKRAFGTKTVVLVSRFVPN